MISHTRFTTSWEGRPLESWASAWAVPELVICASVPSSNDVARQRADDGAPAGLVVLADHQSAGRGRLGRTWYDRPGAAVLLSFLIRPAGGTAPGTAPLRVGMAAAAALRTSSGADVRIKWPNDLVVPGHGKVGGVLCEAVNAGTANGYVVAGIGINVNGSPGDVPADYPAVSLDHCTGTRHERGVIAGALVAALLPLRNVTLDRLSQDELRAFAMLDALHDAFVTVDGEPDAYCARGIDADGALRVERAGVTRRLTAATVRPTQTVEFT